MQVKLFTIPVSDTGSLEGELNSFLRGHKVLDVTPSFCASAGGAFWSFCVRYIEGAPSQGQRARSGSKLDYREILDERCFTVFTCLRECRRQIAREESIPAYAVFIDEELAAFSRLEALTGKGMLSVEGVGDKKMERFGRRLLELYNQATAGNNINIIKDPVDPTGSI